MLAPTIISTFGLALDVAGVILLFFYGVNRNPTLSPEGHTTGFIEGGGSQLDDQAKAKYWTYKWWESVGLICLFFGFLVQIAAAWLSYIWA